MLIRYRNSLEGMIIHQDQGSVLTGYGWTGQLLAAKVQLSNALRGPGDNAVMGSYFGRFRLEYRSLILNAGSLDDVTVVVQDRIQHYYWVRRHSYLGERPRLAIAEDREEG